MIFLHETLGGEWYWCRQTSSIDNDKFLKFSWIHSQIFTYQPRLVVMPSYEHLIFFMSSGWDGGVYHCFFIYQVWGRGGHLKNAPKTVMNSHTQGVWSWFNPATTSSLPAFLGGIHGYKVPCKHHRNFLQCFTSEKMPCNMSRAVHK